MAFVLGTLALVLLGAAQPADAASAKNYSIFFFRPGSEVFGTLQNGTYVQKKTVSVSKDRDLAAVSRTSLLLYNKSTGATETGTFTKGMYSKKHTYSLTPGFDLATASCETVMLYRQSDGKSTTATLTGGALGQRHTSTIDSDLPYQFLSASCDTYIGGYQDGEQTSLDYGLLKAGALTNKGGEGLGGQNIDLLGMTDNSYLIYGHTAAGYGATYGTAKGGDLVNTGDKDGFSLWDKLAGSPDTLLFYKVDSGVEATPTLTNGVYAGGGAGPTFKKSWKLIAAGK